jgi:Na+/H+-dicarboxylate symporter
VPLPDIGQAGSVAGWLVAVVMMASVIGLIVGGKLVPGATHDAALKRLEEQDERQDKMLDQLEELTQHDRALSAFVPQLLAGYRGDAPSDGRAARHDREAGHD